MSIASFAIGEIAVAGQPAPPKNGGKPPRNRLVTAKADHAEHPEPR